jgi:hypothetical protein
LTVLPATVGIVGAALVLAVPRTSWHRSGRSRALAGVVDGIQEAGVELVRPHWRLLGAFGYLGFDIAVLGLTFAGLGHPIGARARPGVHHRIRGQLVAHTRRDRRA